MSSNSSLLVIFMVFIVFISGFSVKRRDKRSLVHYKQKDAGVEKQSGRKMSAATTETKTVQLIKKPKNYDKIVKKVMANKNITTDFVEEQQQAQLGRGATSDSGLYWNYKMTILIEPDFSDEAREEILSAIYTLSQSMQCFNFYVVAKSSKVSRRKDHLVISKTGSGCYSYLGRQQGQQVTVLGERCNLYGTTIHEIMHVLGFYHEHVRPDRDQFVEINTNVLDNDSKRRQYEIRHQQLVFASKYDFDSLMHYPLGAALQAKKGKIPPGVQPGQRNHLSDQDIIRLRGLYPCDNAPTYKKK